jgi:hypothetical protein
MFCDKGIFKRKKILTELVNSGEFYKFSPTKIREILGTNKESTKVDVERELEREVFYSLRLKERYARSVRC